MAIRTNEGSRLKFIPTDFGDLAQEIAGMTDTEELVFFRFLLFYMNKGYLPADDERLKGIARLSTGDVGRAIAAFKELDAVHLIERVDESTGEMRTVYLHNDWHRTLEESKSKVDGYHNQTKRATEVRLARQAGGDRLAA